MGDWVTTINAAIAPGTVAAEDAWGGRLRLGHASRVRVTAYGGTGGAAAAFAVIGLPIEDRDVGAGAVASMRVDPSPNAQQISDPVAVPSGANFLTLWIKPTAGSSTAFESQFAVAFDDGTEGVPVPAADAVAPLLDLAVPPLVHARASAAAMDRKVDIDIFRLVGIQTGAFLLWMPLEYQIPAGATTVRVVALSTEGTSGAACPTPDTPSIEATLSFAAR